MPRMIRLESPGSLYHIMARGIDGARIYQDQQDYREFLSRLSVGIASCKFQCFAWCLMENHYHLLVRSSDAPLSCLMRPLNGGYARWFNHKYKRRGYLFQDRYKSVLCQDQEYAKQLVRYIHLNPIRGGIVRSLEMLINWPWCGHGFLLGNTDALGDDFQERKEPLRRFGASEKHAIHEYMRYMGEGIDAADFENAGKLDVVEYDEVAGSQKGWPAVIGNPDFAKKAMIRHEVGRLRRHRKADYDHVLETVASQVCQECEIKREELNERGRANRRSNARALFCYRVCKDELIPLSVVARFFRITIPAVSKQIKIVIEEQKRNG